MTDATDSPHFFSIGPFRRAVFRGLGLVLPALLTIVLFIWAWHTVESYVLQPLESGARHLLVAAYADVVEPDEIDLSGVEPIVNDEGQIAAYLYHGKPYVAVDQQWIPQPVFDAVQRDPGDRKPTTAKGYYQRYARIVWLNRARVLPVFLCLFISILYLLGKFLAAGVGRIVWNGFEALIHRLPLIRNVYSSFKQVTDFLFSEQEVQFTRVVAVEYPRKGIWAIGFVTGEGMQDMRDAATEPVVTLLIPTSPMPATGFTATVRKSETVDLNISIDQAIQFVVSCGVVIPEHQQTSSPQENQAVGATISAAIAEHTSLTTSDFQPH